MSPELKYFLGILWILLGFIWYYPYFRDIIRGKTKPHPFSWLIWWILNGVGFVVQIQEGGWFWSYTLAVLSLICLTLSGIGFYQRHVEYHKWDVYLLFWALLSIGLWYFIKNPIYSVLLITFIDLLGFIPTIRKVYHQPESETLSAWYIGIIRTIIWILALSVYSFNTVFYAGAVGVFNAITIVLIHIQIHRIKSRR